MSIQAIVQVYDNCLIICHNIDNRNMNVKNYTSLILERLLSVSGHFRYVKPKKNAFLSYDKNR